MKFAYADPPYLGCGHLYDDHHADSREYDDPEAHRLLIERLCDEYPDGWAMSLHEPSLRTILPMCQEDCRVLSWVKPFAAYKANVTRAFAWEPIIARGGRPIGRDQPTVRDWFACGITLKKGLVGAKPAPVCHWLLDWLNFKPGDTMDDLFPGTGVMGECAAARNGEPMTAGLFAEVAAE
jgi:hypothetical protein